MACPRSFGNFFLNLPYPRSGCFLHTPTTDIRIRSMSVQEHWPLKFVTPYAHEYLFAIV